MKVRSWPDRSKRRDDSKLPAVKAGELGALMDILETQLKHVGYELDMLVYTFDKLLLRGAPCHGAASRRGRSMR